MCGEMLQPDLLATLHRLSSHTELLVILTLDGPVTVDILLDHGARHGLLTRARPILDVMAVQPHLVGIVHELHGAAASHHLGFTHNIPDPTYCHQE